jgi:branched-chain amino acid transport system ATP-binding protein
MLEISDINTFRASAHVLHGVTLAVRADEVVCLVGRNGAGKTTTIESVMGLLPVKSGTIRFRDREITRLPGFSPI